MNCITPTFYCKTRVMLIFIRSYHHGESWWDQKILRSTYRFESNLGRHIPLKFGDDSCGSLSLSRSLPHTAQQKLGSRYHRALSEKERIPRSGQSYKFLAFCRLKSKHRVSANFVQKIFYRKV